MTLARRGGLLRPNVVVVPGYQILAKEVLDPHAAPDLTPIVARSTDEVEEVLGIKGAPHVTEED